MMKTKILLVLSLILQPAVFHSEAAEPPKSSYAPVAAKESLSEIMARMKTERGVVMKKQMDLLRQRYDLRNEPAPGVAMSGGKPIQQGVRAKLKGGMTWDQLGVMAPEEILERDVFPDGFLGLPHPNHPEGGMVFPKFHIDELKKQEGRGLEPIRGDMGLFLSWPALRQVWQSDQRTGHSVSARRRRARSGGFRKSEIGTVRN